MLPATSVEISDNGWRGIGIHGNPVRGRIGLGIFLICACEVKEIINFPGTPLTSTPTWFKGNSVYRRLTTIFGSKHERSSARCCDLALVMLGQFLQALVANDVHLSRGGFQNVSLVWKLDILTSTKEIPDQVPECSMLAGKQVFVESGQYCAHILVNDRTSTHITEPFFIAGNKFSHFSHKKKNFREVHPCIRR